MKRKTKKHRRRLVDRTEYQAWGLPEPSETEQRTCPNHFVLVDKPKPGFREFYIALKGGGYVWYENMSQAVYD